MDRYYAKAYMQERLQDAEHRRLIAQISSKEAKPPLFDRLHLASRLNFPFLRPVATSVVATPIDCPELDCCPA